MNGDLMTDDSNWNPYLQHTFRLSTASGSSSQPYSYYPSAYYNYQWPVGSSSNTQPYYPTTPLYPTSTPAAKPAPKPPSPSPSPPPPSPSTYKHWDEVLLSFLRELGLTQAATGLEADMLALNTDWEQRKVPGAVQKLIRNLSHLGGSIEDTDSPMAEATVPTVPPATTGDVEQTTLDDRKLAYVHLSDATQPKTPSSINKEISLFLAQKRARNDASNRSEFVYSLSEKRRRLQDDNDNEAASSSCARVDAKPIDRDVQMKYDIAKNEDGPLRRTVSGVPSQTGDKSGAQGKGKAKEDAEFNRSTIVASPATAESHPGLDERLRTIEIHLAIKYVPSIPSTLLDRLKCLEEHIIRLEKDYPPWAALHFNQPNRGWLPPPRPTPIIVPPQMRLPTTTSKDRLGSPTTPDENGASEPSPPGAGGSRTRAKGKVQSTLHRAVMEKLEVKQAMQDLGRRG